MLSWCSPSTTSPAWISALLGVSVLVFYAVWGFRRPSGLTPHQSKTSFEIRYTFEVRSEHVQPNCEYLQWWRLYNFTGQPGRVWPACLRIFPPNVQCYWCYTTTAQYIHWAFFCLSYPHHQFRFKVAMNDCLYL